MNPLLNLIQLQDIEKQCSVKNIFLSERVGLSVFNWIESHFSKTDKILICISNGYKEAYGLAVALQLINNGYMLDFVYLAHDTSTKYKELLNNISKSKLPLTKLPADLNNYSLLIDALDNITDIEIVNQINYNSQYILSLEAPYGVNPFTGSVDDVAINADTTITFISDKAGFHTANGIDYSGEVLVVDLISLNELSLINTVPKIEFNTVTNMSYQTLIRQNSNTNKGSYGTVAIIGGNKGMHGAIYLAGRASLMVGCGKVILSSLDPDFSLDFRTPELMHKSIDDVINHIHDYDAIAIGPGFGHSDEALEILKRILNVITDTKLVVDADALNLIAKDQNLQEKFKNIPHKIITPHPGEASRILSRSIDEIQHDRFQALIDITDLLHSIVVLKGAGTLVGNQQNIYINTTGNPGLSNAGQGDTLTGVITGLLAQGLDVLTSARLGVYLHGLAGDRLVIKKRGYNGVLASIVADEVCQTLNDLLYGELFI